MISFFNSHTPRSGVLRACIVVMLALAAVVACGAREITGYFVGAIPGLGDSVQFGIPPGADTLSRTAPLSMLSRSANLTFTVQSSEEGIVLLVGSLARAECKLSSGHDSLLGMVRMRDGSGRQFALKKVADYDYVHRTIPVAVWYATERREFPDLTIAVDGLNVTGTAQRYDEVMPVHGTYGRDGVLKLAIDSMNLQLTGSFERGGGELVGVMRQKGKAPVDVRYPRVWRPDDSTETIHAALPFTVRILRFHELSKKLSGALSAEIDRIAEVRYRDAHKVLPVISDFSKGYAMSVDANIAYYTPDLVSLDVTTYGDLGGPGVHFFDELATIAVVRGTARPLVLADLFGSKPGSEKRLNDELRAALHGKGVDTAGEAFSLLSGASWCMLPSGLWFCFPPPASAEPPVFALIPFDRIRDIIDPSGPLGGMLGKR